MIEVRRDLELPFVEDGDPQVVAKLAAGLLQVVGADIPAFGIKRTPTDYFATVSQVHEQHANFILAAANMAEPKIQIDDSFEFELHDPAGVGEPWMHIDNSWLTNTSGRKWKQLPMKLRLHTADDEFGAEVRTANTRPGSSERIGDRGMYIGNSPHDELAVERGYDETLAHVAHRLPPESNLASGIDGSKLEKEVYHFTQTPLSSIFFRSSTTMGPSSAHSFYSIGGETARTLTISTIQAYSQPL